VLIDIKIICVAIIIDSSIKITKAAIVLMIIIVFIIIAKSPMIIINIKRIPTIKKTKILVNLTK
jgi:hypothetical protein